MDEDKLQQLAIDTATHKVQIASIVERMDSYHNDSKQRHDKIESMVSALPSEDKIFRMFREEGEKLAKGLINRDEKQQEELNELKTDISAAKKALKWGYGLVATVAGILGYHGFK